MNMNSKWSDFKSIRFKLWRYFLGFFVFLILIIWVLQIFFLEIYYENMKVKETEKIAGKLVDDFRKSGYSIDSLKKEISSIMRKSDVVARVETGLGKNVWTSRCSEWHGDYVVTDQAQKLRTRLLTSEHGAISLITPEYNDTRVLSYGCFLHKETGPGEDIDLKNSYVLYLFAPLYPVKSTISILRVQLIYISIIAGILAVMVALYLSNYISKPILQVADKAKKMADGRYDVRFKESNFAELQELTNTLNTAAIELEKTEQYRKDLMANISHDLRTPLTMIRSYAEMIHDISGKDETKRNEHLHVIMEEAERLNLLVNDMLSLSRMQQGHMILNRSNFDLRRVVETLLPAYEILSKNEGYKFIYNKGEPLFVNADEFRMKRVISNLINNAVKYCGEDKVIVIDLYRNGMKAHFSVKDNGVGIPKDEITQIWNRYYKSSAHHVRYTGGTGLGLAIVKEILSLHEADFGVKSILNKGSDFWFELELTGNK